MLAHPAVRHGTLLTTLLPAPLGRLSLQGSCNGIRAYLPRHLWPDADHEEAQLPNSVGAEERVGNEAVLTLLILPGLLLSSFVSCRQPRLSTFSQEPCHGWWPVGDADGVRAAPPPIPVSERSL